MLRRVRNESDEKESVSQTFRFRKRPPGNRLAIHNSMNDWVDLRSIGNFPDYRAVVVNKGHQGLQEDIHVIRITKKRKKLALNFKKAKTTNNRVSSLLQVIMSLLKIILALDHIVEPNHN